MKYFFALIKNIKPQRRFPKDLPQTPQLVLVMMGHVDQVLRLKSPIQKQIENHYFVVRFIYKI